MSKKNIVDALEGISDAISGGGSSGGGGGSSSGGGSGNSGLGFTPVFYEFSDKHITPLMFLKDGDFVPFTVTDLLGESDLEPIKTVPILIMLPSGVIPGGVFNMKAIAVGPDDAQLVFSGMGNIDEFEFFADSSSSGAFVLLQDDSGAAN